MPPKKKFVTSWYCSALFNGQVGFGSVSDVSSVSMESWKMITCSALFWPPSVMQPPWRLGLTQVLMMLSAAWSTSDQAAVSQFLPSGIHTAIVHSPDCQVWPPPVRSSVWPLKGGTARLWSVVHSAMFVVLGIRSQATLQSSWSTPPLRGSHWGWNWRFSNMAGMAGMAVAVAIVAIRGNWVASWTNGRIVHVWVAESLRRKMIQGDRQCNEETPRALGDAWKGRKMRTLMELSEMEELSSSFLYFPLRSMPSLQCTSWSVNRATH